LKPAISDSIQITFAKAQRDFLARCSAAALSGWSYVCTKQPRAESVAAMLEVRRAYLVDCVARKLESVGNLGQIPLSSTEHIFNALDEYLASISSQYGKAGSAAQKRLKSLLFSLITLLKFGGFFDSAAPIAKTSISARITRIALFFACKLESCEILSKALRKMPDILSACAPASRRFVLPCPRSTTLAAAV
jgi:hypothetical protein